MFRVLVIALVAGGCGLERTGPLTAARIDLGDPSPVCPDGSLLVSTGTDSNGDRELQDDEVTTTTVVCEPAATAGCSDRAHQATGPITLPLSPEREDKLRDVICIEGDVIVINSDEDEVHGLAQLAQVTGNVVLAGDPFMASIDGLAELRTVGGTYLVQGNDDLADLHGLAGLASTGRLAFVANDHLPDLGGLEPLTAITGDLEITDNPELASLTGLQHVTNIHGDVVINGNGALTNLAALDRLTSADSVDISHQLALTTIALPGLQSLEHDLVIENDDGVVSLALPELAAVRDVHVTSNQALRDLALPAMHAMSSLEVTEDPSLAELSVGPAGTVDRVELRSLPALTSVEMPKTTTIHKLALDQVALADFSGFALTTLGELSVTSCRALTSFTGLQVETLTSLRATDSGIKSFDGLDKLETISGDFTFTGNQVKGEPVRAFVGHVRVGGSTTID
jgi:hypothetical protein